MRRGPLLDCVAHVTRVSPPGVKHQVSVIRICLGILLYFSNSPAHISLSPEQKGPTGLKHFKVTTVQSVVTESEVFATKPTSTYWEWCKPAFPTDRHSLTHLSKHTGANFISPMCRQFSLGRGKKELKWYSREPPPPTPFTETVHIGKHCSQMGPL